MLLSENPKKKVNQARQSPSLLRSLRFTINYSTILWTGRETQPCHNSRNFELQTTTARPKMALV